MKNRNPIPPRLATRLLRLFLRDDLQEDVTGDLKENFDFDCQTRTLSYARLNYWRQVILYLRPFAIKKIKQRTSYPTAMYKSYFRAAIQNMVKNKLHTFINITGLAIGMAVAIIISLWIYDEVSFNTQFANSARIGQVVQNVTNNGQVETWTFIPWPLGDEIRKNYGTDFKYVAMASYEDSHTITVDKEKFTKTGIYVEPDFLSMYEVEIVKGTLPAKDPSAIMLSESTAEAFFGNSDAIGQMIGMDGTTFQVSGVYRDFPERSRWTDVHFLAQWTKFIVVDELEKMDDPWRPNGFQLFIMLADHATFESASLKIRDAKLKKVNEALAKKKPELFIHAMQDWHLRAEFNNGKQTGGLIRYVWMFGIVGAFVLFMACINFMDLSTARSEKRAKEIGIRKAVGSYRSQLIAQFFSESILTTFIALVLAVVLAHLLLPLFNTLAEKNMHLPWNNPLLWGGIVAVSIVIGLIAGSYPALYLSAIRPVGALKGAFKAGPAASLPRKVLVVAQFSVSVMMIIGTATVFLQIQHGRNRPLGYSVNRLISVNGIRRDVHTHFDAIRKKLIDNGSIIEMTESVTPSTGGWGSSSRIDWNGKDPELSIDFSVFMASYEYGRTMQWEVLQGRDFSRDFLSDTSGVIVNEAAAKYMNKQDVVGEVLRSSGAPYTIVGVVRDIVYGNPYQPVRPSLYFLSQQKQNILMLRLNPEKPVAESIASIEAVVKPHMAGDPFNYQFMDESQARKFGNEQRVYTLAGIFAGLAIFISCLGIFGLSSFVAEQRTKEVGVRKVLGANLSQLWVLMSKDFAILVILSSLIAAPLAWWMLQSWLESYKYRVTLPWWIFVMATVGTLIITLLTTSWHIIKAAKANPAATLKIE